MLGTTRRAHTVAKSISRRRGREALAWSVKASQVAARQSNG